MADGEGRFFFADLPAGRVLPAGHESRLRAGEVRAARGPGSKTCSCSLGEGERLADVKLRGVEVRAAIGGTVVDEAGEPVVGSRCARSDQDAIAGRTQFGSRRARSPSCMPGAITDDRGMFRLSRMIPGAYVVVVPSTQTTLPAQARRRGTRSCGTNCSWGGVPEVALLGQPRTQQIGDAALMT